MIEEHAVSWGGTVHTGMCLTLEVHARYTKNNATHIRSFHNGRLLAKERLIKGPRDLYFFISFRYRTGLNDMHLRCLNRSVSTITVAQNTQNCDEGETLEAEN